MKIPSRFRFNPWPAAIITWFVLFMGFTVFIVTYLSRQKIELVQTDYYDDEIRYQEQLNRLNRTQSLKEPIAVAYDTKLKAIAITLPNSPLAANASSADTAVKRPNISGRIRLYRPANQSLDRELKLSLDAAGFQLIDVKDLASGLWKVRIYWTMDGQDYYFNQSIIVGSTRS